MLSAMVAFRAAMTRTGEMAKPQSRKDAADKSDRR
jgi:hypothetical protein